MAEGFHSVADEETLKRVLALAKAAKDAPNGTNGEPSKAFANYLGQLVRYATGEDRYWDEPDALLNRALGAWELAKKRKPGEQQLSLVLRESDDWRETRLVLDIVTDDKPFLVDSISAALAELGKPVSFFANAIVDVVRDPNGQRLDQGGGGQTIRESMIHAEMDPPVDGAEVEALDAEIRRVLDDVAAAVEDWEPMRARLAACIAQLETSRPTGVEREDQREAVEFLKWLWDNRFAFFGARHYSYEKTEDNVFFEQQEGKDLGILRDANRRILKATFVKDGVPSPAVEDFMSSGEPIIIAKANARSIVHRRVYMDYIGVKSYAVDGTVIGEDRFIGLFTSEAYNRPASDIPHLRSKVRKVVESASFIPGGHNEKAIVNILETYPRDEMFQDNIDSLRETSLGILRLYKRPRVKLFMRRDRFDRFISALVFIPRDRFSSTVRENIGLLLAQTFHGRISAFYPYFGDAALVRVHFIIGLNPGAPEGPGLAVLTRAIRTLSIDWGDELLEELRSANEGATPQGLFSRYKKAFDAGYREKTSPRNALLDIDAIETLGQRRFKIRAYRAPDNTRHEVNIKIYSSGEPLRLSDLIPKLENLGLSVVQEASFLVRPSIDDDNGKERLGVCWIHDFRTEEHYGRPIDVDGVKSIFEDAMRAVLDGSTEDDGFNALVLLAGLDWREAWMLRAATKYHLQSGFPFSQAYIEETLGKHPEIARALIGVFHARFSPGGPEKPAAREKEVAEAEARILSLLESVESLDEDRIVRRYLTLFAATLRTNFYQRGEDGASKNYISFKVDSHKIADLPDPKPYREIFVSSPRIDGVHLRFGPVARGGLRWSDRKEDFRTEVLGLVKAQRVKNAVIVPTGSKGGFYPKQLPVGGDRGAIYEEGREAYKIFIRGLLDLTDNIVAGKTVAPANMVFWDDPDPYLVVAADKGTAQFSDTANDISSEYGFWLGDAFASGGSAGYDHKVMGITARGGWEAVKRHFREMGKNIQEEPFTVAGVGDMSGDVFGNGMLLSEQIKLVAAFDHRDIFVDPDPDPTISYQERKRLFELPRSSWQDYDPKLISKGGDVFARRAKSISLSPEIQAALDIKSEKLTPAELIKGILKARVELFWLGGIGTYFKAGTEENASVGDRANDAVRIDADDMRMNVVGEGANLGLTQQARILFARNGGSINTDAIDNSAGVDSSDHEVNIKILLSAAIEQSELKQSDRDDLLKSMTEDVAEYVLQHNYVQTRALSDLSDTATHDLEAQARLMTALENQGRLDRKIEGLPDEKKIALLRSQGLGLTRPELSVLLAYAKIWLFEEMIASTAPDDPALERELFGYFPEALHQFNQSLVKHRLRREIIATRLSNEIVDTCGPTFAHRVVEASGARFSDMVLAYEGARRILSLGYFAESIDALDNKAPAALQTSLYATAANLLSEQVYRIISDAKASALIESRGLKGLIDQYKEPVTAFKDALAKILSPTAAKALKVRRVAWRKAGAPEDVAKEAALMPALEFAFDVVNLSRDTKWSATNIGAVFFAVGDRLHIDPARTKARNSPPDSHYDRLAVRRLTEELTARQGDLAKNIGAFAKEEPDNDGGKWLKPLMDKWRRENEIEIDRFERYTAELDLDNGVSVGKLSLFSRKLADLVERT